MINATTSPMSAKHTVCTYEEFPVCIRRRYTHMTAHLGYMTQYGPDDRWLICTRQKVIVENLDATGYGEVWLHR